MKTSEGLTGLVVRERHIVAVREPQEHPLYHYSRTGEERFHSFFGVPLLDAAPVGVLVLQTREPRDFNAETSALLSIAYQWRLVVNAAAGHGAATEDAARRYAGELERCAARRPGADAAGPARAAAARRGTVPAVVLGRRT